MKLPVIIQGGMGVAISDWRLASAVSQLGHLGVVSGTGISRVMTCRLMDGDIGGHVRRALSTFSFPEICRKILDRYFIAGGKPAEVPYKSQPAYTLGPPQILDQLTALANYVEVFLARENHAGQIGINLLEKVQLSSLPALYGAMLAGVDFVLMGAGIPMQVARILDKLASHEPVSYRIDVQGAAPDDDVRTHFDPEKVFPGAARMFGLLKRPKFVPIVSSTVLAQALINRSEGSVDGFVVEGYTAGGHNAPPRGALKLNEHGEPIYGIKDSVDLEKIRSFGRPFWLAGGYGHPDQLQKSKEAGATGVQVGTAFSLCDESGMEPDLKKRTIRSVIENHTRVHTSPSKSPTGFPFKVADVEGTLSEPHLFEKRPRICDLSFLRSIVKNQDGQIVYRCPAEPVDDYVRKGGKAEETVGRTCLCNNLMASAGFAQKRRDGYLELPLVTSGDDLPVIKKLVKPGRYGFSAKDVVDYILSPPGGCTPTN